MAASETPNAASQMSSPQYQILSAAYQSSDNAPFALMHKIQGLATDKVSDRTGYLGTLRRATAEMQEKINKELTSRMEEDKAREAIGTNKPSKGNGIVDEVKEEDRYGEVAEEED